MSQLSTKAIQIAISQLHTQEQPKGSNWGPPDGVPKYLKSVGLTFPASWCMAFVYWCFREAAIQLGIPSPLIRTGGVLNAYNQSSKAAKQSSPQIGDIFIMDMGHGLGHTGIIENVEGSLIHTIEGNTNDTGSREGFEVCRRTRHISSIKAYLRY